LFSVAFNILKSCVSRRAIAKVIPPLSVVADLLRDKLTPGKIEYHIGQIVFIGKMACDKNWVSLSIPKGSSNAVNAEMFSKPKHTTS
jgi:Protein of unknown function (DUF1572)